MAKSDLAASELTTSGTPGKYAQFSNELEEQGESSV